MRLIFLLELKLQFTFVLGSDWCLPTHIKSFCRCRRQPIRCCAKIVNLAIRQKKRRSDSASVTLHDETKSHHRRAAEGRYTGRSPVHQLRRRAPHRWHSAKRRVRVDHDVHRLESPGRPRVSRERVPGYRWTTGSRTYATAYPSLPSTRGRIARNSTSSSAPRPTPWSSTSTCASTPSRTVSAD